MNEQTIYVNALNKISFLGPIRISSLISHCGSADSAWKASAQQLEKIPELKGFVDRFIHERRQIDPHAEWRRLQLLNISCLTLESQSYPSLLRQIANPPPILYTLGCWADRPVAVAIVGSRRCTLYGLETARRLSGELAASGVAVVSGLALGVDTAAHQGALSAGGYTIAVLGCGLDRCYPPANAGLMKQISEKGSVLSEFPLGTRPLPQHFPRRNRIISGLTMGTVVVEAPLKSGALITADIALEQNREVFAVPGSVNSPYSRGCHKLLKDGARLTESGADILEELSLTSIAFDEAQGKSVARVSCTEAEERLFRLIPYHPLHMDEIITISGLGAERIGPLLLELELKGLIRQLPGKYFSRR